MQALQQHGPRVAPEAVQNPPAGAAKDKSEIAHTDQDRKILQLCGEDSAGSRPGGRGRVEPRGFAWSCGGGALFGVGGA